MYSSSSENVYSLTNYIEYNVEDRISALTTKDHNKLKVYLDNYDGHCLRAWYYFPEIAKAGLKFADENEICYTAKVGDKFIDFTENQLICYKNETLTGKQLWELLQDSPKREKLLSRDD